MLNVPASWRIPPSFLDTSPFGAGEHGRPLRIILDDHTVEPTAAVALLSAFGSRRGVEVLHTSPAAQQRIELGPEIAGRDALAVQYVTEDGRSMALGALASWRQRARQEATEYGLEEAECFRGLMLAQAASTHQIDALVSESPILQVERWSKFVRNARLMSPREACSLLGLFLRAHHDYTVRIEGNSTTFLSFDRFYRAAAVAPILSGYSNLLHAAVSLHQQDAGTEVYRLTKAVQGRLSRALIARDYVSVRACHWRPDDVWEEALYFFESFLLSLQGGLDALARAVHQLAGLPPNRSRQAAFHKVSWREAVLAAGAGSALSDEFNEGSAFDRATAAISALRNYIHGEVLSEEHVDEDGVIDYGKGVLVASPDSDGELVAALQGLDAEAWGIAESFDGKMLIMPIKFMHAAVAVVWNGLGRLLATEFFAGAASERIEDFDPSFWLADGHFRDELMLLAALSVDPADGLT